MKSKVKEEQKLIGKVKKGNRKSLEKLIDKYGEKLMQYLFSITNDRELSEDLFQLTWIKVMEKIETFKDNMPFSPWLFRIARNSAYDYLKRETRKIEMGENRNVFKTVSNIEEEFEKKDFTEKLLSLLNKEQREIIFLRFFEEKNYSEISEILKIPMGTVKSRLKRTIEYLGKIYRELEVKENEKRM